MVIKWDNPAAIELRRQIVASILEDENPYLGHTDPIKGNNMNEIMVEKMVPLDEMAVKHILTIDPETGEEVKVELLNEFSQESEDSVVTLH